jgi:hypothetical protein
MNTDGIDSVSSVFPGNTQFVATSSSCSFVSFVDNPSAKPPPAVVYGAMALERRLRFCSGIIHEVHEDARRGNDGNAR